MITAFQLKRLEDSYKAITKEDVRCEAIKDIMFVYASELACLRLFYQLAMAREKYPLVGYSVSNDAWFFSYNL